MKRIDKLLSVTKSWRQAQMRGGLFLDDSLIIAIGEDPKKYAVTLPDGSVAYDFIAALKNRQKRVN